AGCLFRDAAAAAREADRSRGGTPGSEGDPDFAAVRPGRLVRELLSRVPRQARCRRRGCTLGDLRGRPLLRLNLNICTNLDKAPLARGLVVCGDEFMRQWLSPDTERAAALLEAHPDYRILRSLPPLDLLPLPAAEGRVRTAAVLDTETTSLDPATGHIIELAICHVWFDA